MDASSTSAMCTTAGGVAPGRGHGRRDLQAAARVGGDDQVRPGRQHRGRLPGAEFSGRLRLQQVVDARRPAAAPRRRPDSTSSSPGIARSRSRGWGSDPLRVTKVASLVIQRPDRKKRPATRTGSPPPPASSARYSLRSRTWPAKNSARRRRRGQPSRCGHLHRRPAARRVDHDHVHVRGLERGDRPPVNRGLPGPAAVRGKAPRSSPASRDDHVAAGGVTPARSRR